MIPNYNSLQFGINKKMILSKNAIQNATYEIVEKVTKEIDEVTKEVM
ncbi:MAG: hypothetical protein WBN50_11855 [Lutimonas sp.]